MKHSIVYALIALAVVALMVSMSVQAPIGLRKDPLPSFKFRVELDGVVQAFFQDVSGIKCQTDVIEYRDGADPSMVKLLPGISRCGPIVLTGGLTTSFELWNWYQKTLTGKAERKSGSIIVLDHSGADAARYNFFEAWPSSYEVGDLNASSSGVAIEKLVIQTERIERS